MVTRKSERLAARVACARAGAKPLGGPPDQIEFALCVTQESENGMLALVLGCANVRKGETAREARRLRLTRRLSVARQP